MNTEQKKMWPGAWVTSGVAVAALAGCASQPDKMQAQYVSPAQYESYDCTRVTNEMGQTSRRINELYTRLKKTADNDAAQMGVGLVLFWPTLFFLEGGDGPDAGEYSRLKGEYEALETVAIQKNCSVPATAKIARWAHLAQKPAEEHCVTPAAPTLVAATGMTEDYSVACGAEPPVMIRCENSECRALQ